MQELIALPEPETFLGPLDEKGITFTPTGLVIQPWVRYGQWEKYGRRLQVIDRGIQWAIGDWIVFGEDKFGEEYAQAVEVTGLKVKTIQNYAVVARAVPRSRRRDSDLVDFSTHAEVACLKPADQERILAKAAKERLTVKSVRREAERIKRESKPRPKETEFVLPVEARACLDDYMGELARFEDEHLEPGWYSLELMLHRHGKHALWQRNRTIETDCAAIVQMFSGDDDAPGAERASDSEVSVWLEHAGYFISDADLDDRLALMVEKKMLDVMSVEESRQDGRRGVMIDLYRLNADYAERAENAA